MGKVNWCRDCKEYPSLGDRKDGVCFKCYSGDGFVKDGVVEDVDSGSYLVV